MTGSVECVSAGGSTLSSYSVEGSAEGHCGYMIVAEAHGEAFSAACTDDDAGCDSMSASVH